MSYHEDPIDFPVSWDWHRHYERIAGRPDPGPNYPAEPIEVIEPVFRPRPVDKEIDQLKAQVNYLTNKIGALRAEKSKTSKDKSQSGGRAKPRFTGVI